MGKMLFFLYPDTIPQFPFQGQRKISIFQKATFWLNTIRENGPSERPEADKTSKKVTHHRRFHALTSAASQRHSLPTLGGVGMDRRLFQRGKRHWHRIALRNIVVVIIWKPTTNCLFIQNRLKES